MNALATILSGKLIAVFLFAILLIAVSTALKSKRKTKRPSDSIKRRDVLTPREQPMYFRLVEALPNHVVLTQVAFSALLDTKAQATRNTFDRKVADFVICRKSFAAIAIIELDDASHGGRENEDMARDLLLTSAGYKVLRYKQIPDAAAIRADLTRSLANSLESPPTARIEPVM